MILSPTKKQLEQYQKAIHRASPDQQPEIDHLTRAHCVDSASRKDRR
jgi:hypothetical protein